MDYVNSSGKPGVKDDRDNISGARVFDGEDQGKIRSAYWPRLLALFWMRKTDI